MVILKVIFHSRFAISNMIIMTIFHYSKVLEFPLLCNIKIIKPWVMISMITSIFWNFFIKLVGNIYYPCGKLLCWLHLWNFSVTLVGIITLGNFIKLVGVITSKKLYYACGSDGPPICTLDVHGVENVSGDMLEQAVITEIEKISPINLSNIHKEYSSQTLRSVQCSQTGHSFCIVNCPCSQ